MSVTGVILTPGVVFAPRRPVLPRFPLQPEGLFRDGTAGALMDASALALAGRALFYTDAGNTAAEPGENIHTFLDTARARLWSSGAAYVALEGSHATQATTSQQPVMGSAPVGVRNLLPGNSDHINGMDQTGMVISAATVPGRAGSAPLEKVVPDTGTDTRRYFSLGVALTYDAETEMTFSFDVVEGEYHIARLRFHSGLARYREYDFDLVNGTVTHRGSSTQPVEIETSINEVVGSPGVYHCVAKMRGNGSHIYETHLTAVPSGAGRDFAGDGTSGAYVGRIQVEYGTTETAYQQVSPDGLTVTEPGVSTFNYLRFDGVDDKLSQVLPDGLSGDVMIFGRKGSWIDSAVTIAPGGTLTAIHGGNSVGANGVIPALGDIVGWIALNRTITDEERIELLAYYAKRGAGGLLVPGDELIRNGDFSDSMTDWTLSNDADGGVVNGAVVFGREADNFDAILSQFVTGEPETYRIVSFEVVAVSSPSMRLEVRGQGPDVIYQNLTAGVHEVVVPSGLSKIQFVTRTTEETLSLDNISVKKLVKS